MSEGLGDYRGSDGRLQAADARAEERIADQQAEDYFGYEPPEYRGPGEYVNLPTMPYASYYTGEAAMQYAPLPDRPNRPSLGGLLAAGETDWSYGEHCHIEHLWQWLSGMNHELVQTHAVGWTRAARLLESAARLLRQRAEALAGAWRSPAATIFLEQVGRTLFSIDEWRRVAHDNAAALEVVARETGLARFELGGLYERYLAARDAAAAGDPAGGDPAGGDPGAPGGQSGDRTTTGTTVPEPEPEPEEAPRTVDEVRREFHPEAVAIARRAADAYTNSQFFLLDQGREFAGPREVSTAGGAPTGPGGGSAPLPPGAPPWLSPGGGPPPGPAAPGAGDSSYPAPGAPVPASSLAPIGVPGSGVSPGLGGYLAGTAGLPGPTPAPAPAAPGPPALGGIPAGPVVPPVAAPPAAPPPALGRPAAPGAPGAGPALRPGAGPAPVPGAAPAGHSGAGPLTGARGGGPPGAVGATPRSALPPPHLAGGATAAARPGSAGAPGAAVPPGTVPPRAGAANAGAAAGTGAAAARAGGGTPAGPPRALPGLAGGGAPAGPLRPSSPAPAASRPVALPGRRPPGTGHQPPGTGRPPGTGQQPPRTGHQPPGTAGGRAGGPELPTTRGTDQAQASPAVLQPAPAQQPAAQGATISPDPPEPSGSRPGTDTTGRAGR